MKTMRAASALLMAAPFLITTPCLAQVDTDVDEDKKMQVKSPVNVILAVYRATISYRISTIYLWHQSMK
ncbi:MAG: hypothetical protein ACI9LG_000208 [Moritella dasanensis]|jgi:hypothetical protein